MKCNREMGICEYDYSAPMYNKYIPKDEYDRDPWSREPNDCNIDSDCRDHEKCNKELGICELDDNNPFLRRYLPS